MGAPFGEVFNFAILYDDCLFLFFFFSWFLRWVVFFFFFLFFGCQCWLFLGALGLCFSVR